jgi:hypothetical protein
VKVLLDKTIGKMGANTNFPSTRSTWAFDYDWKKTEIPNLYGFQDLLYKHELKEMCSALKKMNEFK